MTIRSSPQPTLHSLQAQFRDLCVIGMRGAEAISSFRENPKEKLAAVKECTAQIKAGISGLRTDLEAAKVALLSGQEMYVWEYQALKDIAPNAGLSMKQIEANILVQNGSIVKLNLLSTKISDLTPLANLSSLRDLSLLGCEIISDLTPLAGLCSLRELGLNSTRVSDLTPLSNLSSLQWLDLNHTHVLDLTPLANLSSLRELWLRDTPALSSSSYIITALKDRGVKVLE